METIDLPQLTHPSLLLLLNATFLAEKQ